MIITSTVSSAIKKEFGSFFSTDAHKDNDLIRYINSRIRYIVISKNFPFNKYSHQLVTDDINTSYDIPYQIETFFVLDSSWNEIELFTFEDYYREKDKTNKICIFESTLTTEMKWTFNIFYRGFPTSITGLDWTINVPDHFYDLLVAIWAYYGFLDVKAYQKAGERKSIADWMIKSLATRQSDKFPLKTKRLNTSKTNTW